MIQKKELEEQGVKITTILNHSHHKFNLHEGIPQFSSLMSWYLKHLMCFWTPWHHNMPITGLKTANDLRSNYRCMSFTTANNVTTQFFFSYNVILDIFREKKVILKVFYQINIFFFFCQKELFKYYKNYLNYN